MRGIDLVARPLAVLKIQCRSSCYRPQFEKVLSDIDTAPTEAGQVAALDDALSVHVREIRRDLHIEGGREEAPPKASDDGAGTSAVVRRVGASTRSAPRWHPWRDSR